MADPVFPDVAFTVTPGRTTAPDVAERFQRIKQTHTRVEGGPGAHAVLARWLGIFGRPGPIPVLATLETEREVAWLLPHDSWFVRPKDRDAGALLLRKGPSVPHTGKRVVVLVDTGTRSPTLLRRDPLSSIVAGGLPPGYALIAEPEALLPPQAQLEIAVHSISWAWDGTASSGVVIVTSSPWVLQALNNRITMAALPPEARQAFPDPGIFLRPEDVAWFECEVLSPHEVTFKPIEGTEQGFACPDMNAMMLSARVEVEALEEAFEESRKPDGPTRTPRKIWHDEAMAHGHRGFAALKAGDAEAAREAFRLALPLEERVAMTLLVDGEEPTRSFIFRSAASVALLAGEKKAALRLAHFGLAGDPTDEIRDDLEAVIKEARA